jgi:hypothetical protein
MEVLTPIPLILSSLFTGMKTRYSDAVFKFDPSMEYVNSMSGLRALRHSLDTSNINVFPLFVFNRTNLIPMNNTNRRFFPMAKNELTGTALKYSMKSLQCDILFKLFHKDVIFTDTFEIMYNVVESVNTIKYITVDLPDIGDFDFYLDWKNIDEGEYNKKDNFYLTKSFSATLRGSFFVFDETDLATSLITSINARILDFHSQVLVNQILP